MGVFKDCGCGCNGEMAKQKFIISIMSACIFYIVMNKEIFELTNKYLGNWIVKGGCPTKEGFILHSFVFALIAFGTMIIRKQNNLNEKMKISAFSGLLFYIIANPITFKYMANIFGKCIADTTGCPTNIGIFVHSIIFILVIFLTMNGKRVKGCNCKTK